MKVLKGLYYSKDHEWVKVSGNRAYIGITDYAQHALGSIVFVDLPEVDSELAEGETFGAVESVKAASDLLTPVDCTVIEVNEAVIEEPELVNEDAFENWMLRVELKDKAQLEGLLTAEDYKEFCEEEA
jgi:glycine cleavage system H protein